MATAAVSLRGNAAVTLGAANAKQSQATAASAPRQIHRRAGSPQAAMTAPLAADYRGLIGEHVPGRLGGVRMSPDRPEPLTGESNAPRFFSRSLSFENQDRCLAAVEQPDPGIA